MANLQDSINQLKTENVLSKEVISKHQKEKEDLQKNIGSLTEKNDSYLKRGMDLSNEFSAAKQKIESLETETSKLREELAHFKTKEEQRRNDYDKSHF